MKQEIKQATVRKTKRTITITLPVSAGEYLGIKNILFWKPVNGVLQLASSPSLMTIPCLEIKQDMFLPQ